ncbi:hypothetical protein GWN91_05380, partial [Candidatus Saccharibacteria bacterium]|nr:hypothetical protein [Candidatus Saccharibacteria bacterium]NIV03098.1 hypothetical protein [Calditrichia bacterium]NIW79850.1 hypothetical protein [Calditrichia bacterium]
EKGRRSERILKGIRRVKRIYVFYPAHLSEEEAQDFYDEIVETQIKKHKRWLIVDGVLLPFSAIFTLVPGPNVLLIYLAWRTLAHYQTKKGGEKAADDLKVSFHKEPQLDKLESLIDKSFVLNRNGRIKRIGERLGIEDLDQLY